RKQPPGLSNKLAACTKYHAPRNETLDRWQAIQCGQPQASKCLAQRNIRSKQLYQGIGKQPSCLLVTPATLIVHCEHSGRTRFACHPRGHMANFIDQLPCIPQTEIETLASDRMECLRRIAYQDGPLRSHS